MGVPHHGEEPLRGDEERDAAQLAIRAPVEGEISSENEAIVAFDRFLEALEEKLVKRIQKGRQNGKRRSG